MLTLKDMITCGLISNCGEGVKIVATVCSPFIQDMIRIYIYSLLGYGDFPFSSSS